MPDLVATAWTSAGDTSPMRVPATSPVPIAERVAAVAEAGFCGLGLIADDLAVIRDTIGFVGLRDLLADHGLTHIEIELIERWWIPRGEPGDTYDVRDLLFDAAEVLSPSFIKIGSENGPAIDNPLHSSAHCATWRTRPPSTGRGSPSSRCRSPPSPPFRWARRSSTRQAIPPQDCWSTRGMSSARGRR